MKTVKGQLGGGNRSSLPPSSPKPHAEEFGSANQIPSICSQPRCPTPSGGPSAFLACPLPLPALLCLLSTSRAFS